MAEHDAATPAQQRAFWDAVLASWQENHQRQLDDDDRFDREAARRDREWCK